MRARNEDLTGNRYGRLVAIERARVQSGKLIIAGWLCQCDCGVAKKITTGALRQGLTISCGCAKLERISQQNRQHGHSKSGGAYSSWTSLRDRCRNPKSPMFYMYGGRGITVCDRWDSFELFLLDMGPRPVGGSIERKDVNAGYSPENCEWIPISQQAKNKTTTRYVRLNGTRLIQADAARQLGVLPQTLNKWRHDPRRIPAGLDLVLTL